MYSEEFKSKIVEEILAGLPIKKAARDYKIERHTVQNWVRKATGLLPMLRKHWVSDKQRIEAIRQVESGARVVDVAQTFNVVEQTVRNWISNKNRILAVYSIQNTCSGTEETAVMPRNVDSKEIRLQNRNLKDENEFLKAKVAYLEELMKISNIKAESFKKKHVMRQSTGQLNEEEEQ